ncbi:FlhC family transcriptional regulator [Aromatoleum evansii]|uniref:FlhC family transcriptional regulator n=1 Tax=Aromatoleum evansii TaxID=59406 RepID=UPI00145D0F79|nr:FlhC family transcriptional regulator [Aromatoleum evansii]NMG28376.1 hypothetical protein [Aromatoleum evansii]
MGRTDQRTEPVKRNQAIMYAAKLAELGARPPTIAGLLPYLPETMIKDIFAEVRGERSRRGPTPYKTSAHFSSPRNRIQATLALVLFVEYRNTGIHDIDAIIATFERYCQLFGAQTEQKGLSFDRLVKLISNYLHGGGITLEKCPGCGMLHIHDVHELLTARDCPLRKLVPEFNTPYLYKRAARTPQSDKAPAPQPHTAPLWAERSDSPRAPQRLN